MKPIIGNYGTLYCAWPDTHQAGFYSYFRILNKIFLMKLFSDDKMLYRVHLSVDIYIP